MFQAVLDSPGYHGGLGCFDDDGALLGFLIYNLLPPESEIEDIAVEPPRQRQGVASSLMEAYCDILEEHNCDSSYLEVRISNLPAIRLYERFGYARTGIRKNYYPGPDGAREDAVLMARRGKSDG